VLCGKKKSRIFEKFVSFTLCGRKNQRKFATRPKIVENQAEKWRQKLNFERLFGVAFSALKC
jgi:hypothetical protein